MTAVRDGRVGVAGSTRLLIGAAPAVLVAGALIPRLRPDVAIVLVAGWPAAPPPDGRDAPAGDSPRYRPVLSASLRLASSSGSSVVWCTVPLKGSSAAVRAPTLPLRTTNSADVPGLSSSTTSLTKS